MLKKRLQTALSLRRGQVTLLFLSVMASLIVLAFIVIVVGKTAKDKTYADNAADAGALATCSIMAQGFNDMSKSNGNQDGENERESKDNQQAMDNQRRANEGHDTTTWAEGAQPSSLAAVPPGTSGYQSLAKDETRKEADNMDKSDKNNDQNYERGQQEDREARERLYGLIS